MLTRASKFLSFQEVKIQEMASQVPVGHIPRTLTIHVNGDLVRLMNPGDIVDVSGIFLPSPYTGFRALKAGLLTETFLEAQYVQQHKKQYESLDITPEIRDQMIALNREGNGTITGAWPSRSLRRFMATLTSRRFFFSFFAVVSPRRLATV